jgi:pyruvate dehydrogenase (quinone)
VWLQRLVFFATFLGNPEYGVEFSPIDYVKFAEACGGKGYYIKEPDEAKSLVHFAMKEKRPTLIEVEVVLLR